MAIKRTKNVLGYVGVTAPNPPNMVRYNRDPKTTDCRGFTLGTIWIYSKQSKIFILTAKTGGVGTWSAIQTGGGVFDLEGIKTDDGLVATGDVAGHVTASGGSNIETYRISATEYGVKTVANMTLGGSISAPVITGGVITGLALINRGVVRATITGTLYASKGNDGEVLIGGTGVDSEWGNITGGDGITVTNGTNTIEVSTGGAGSSADGTLLIGSGTGGPAWGTIAAGDGIIITNTANGIKIEATSGDNDLQEGTIVENPEGADPGTSWKDCDGSRIDQGAYADLFARIGHRYATHEYTDVETNLTPEEDPEGDIKYSAGDGFWYFHVADGIYTSPDIATWTKTSIALPANMHSISCVHHNGLASGAGGAWVIGYRHVKPLRCAPSPYYYTKTKVLYSTDLVAFTTSEVSTKYNRCSHVCYITYNDGVWYLGTSTILGYGPYTEKYGVKNSSPCYKSNSGTSWTKAPGDNTTNYMEFYDGKIYINSNAATRWDNTHNQNLFDACNQYHTVLGDCKKRIHDISTGKTSSAQDAASPRKRARVTLSTALCKTTNYFIAINTRGGDEKPRYGLHRERLNPPHTKVEISDNFAYWVPIPTGTMQSGGITGVPTDMTYVEGIMPGQGHIIVVSGKTEFEDAGYKFSPEDDLDRWYQLPGYTPNDGIFSSATNGIVGLGNIHLTATQRVSGAGFLYFTKGDFAWAATQFQLPNQPGETILF